MTKGYTSRPLSFTRRMVIAAIAANKKNAIHCVTKIDVTKARHIIKSHFEATNEKISFTAFIARCFAKTLIEFPEMNSFIKGRKLILLEDITISLMVEREIDDVKTPEPFGVKAAQNKTVRKIHSEIRDAQQNKGSQLGSLQNSTWINLIPVFLIKPFIKVADRNIFMAKKYGKVAITSVGMFSKKASWFIPHGTATVLLTVGTIAQENIEGEPRQLLSLTASFDHEIIDGSPAARFMSRFSEIMEDAGFLKNEIQGAN